MYIILILIAMELRIYFYENLLSLKIRPFTKILYYENLEPYSMCMTVCCVCMLCMCVVCIVYKYVCGMYLYGISMCMYVCVCEL